MEKTVLVFRTLEEADEADLQCRAVMSPEERVAIFFALRELEQPDAFEQGLERVYRVLELERI